VSRGCHAEVGVMESGRKTAGVEKEV